MSDAKIIKPTNGRIVWFTPGLDFIGMWRDINKPLAAAICHVWSDRMVNLDVIDSDGIHWPMSSVDLVQPGDAFGYSIGRYCEWMPYQLGQSQKTEDVTGALRGEIEGLRGELDAVRSAQWRSNEELTRAIKEIYEETWQGIIYRRIAAEPSDHAAIISTNCTCARHSSAYRICDCNGRWAK